MSDFESTSDSEIDRIAKQICQLDLVNVKTDIKYEILRENTNTNDVSLSSRYPPSGVTSMINKTQDEQGYTPHDKMKPESINPLRIYLDLYYVTHVEEATDKWN